MDDQIKHFSGKFVVDQLVNMLLIFFGEANFNSRAFIFQNPWKEH